MDRDLVLAGLLIITVSVTLLAVAPWPTPIRPKRSARQWELAAWRTLWWPSVPVVAVTSVLMAGRSSSPLVAAKFCPPVATAATLFDALLGLEDRVERLLAPLSVESHLQPPPGAITLVPVFLAGVFAGIRFGDGLVQTLVKCL